MGISKYKRELLIKFKDNICEGCKKKFETSQLEIHRIRQGCSYEEHRSLMIICSSCHEKFNSAQRIAEGIS